MAALRFFGIACAKAPLFFALPDELTQIVRHAPA
jgi:hypothetical protein